MSKFYYIAIISLKAVVSKHVDMTVHGVFEVEVTEERERVFALNHNWVVIAQGTDIVWLTYPNVPLILLGQDKMSDSHLSEKDNDMH